MPANPHSEAKSGTTIEFFERAQAWWPVGRGPQDEKPTARARLLADAVFEQRTGIRTRDAKFAIENEVNEEKAKVVKAAATASEK